MELYLRQQFDLLLQVATSSFAERCTHRCGGPDRAAEALRTNPADDSLHRNEFVAAFFTENLLDNTAGHCFVLESLAKRTLPADPGGCVEDVLARQAATAFADVLTVRTVQALEQQQIFT
jgi:hypothetical protein